MEKPLLLLKLICSKVEETRQGKLAPVKLAALLWGACVFLHAKVGVRQALAGKKPKPVRNLEEAGCALASLGTDPDPTELYRTFLSVLVFLDKELEPTTFDENWSGEVSLESLQPAPAILSGTVQVWLRGRSLLRRFRGEFEREQEPPLNPGSELRSADHHEMKYESEPDCHLGALSFYLPTLERPDLSFRLARIDSDLKAWQRLVFESALLAEEGTFRIALCPLQGPWRPQFRLAPATDQEGPTFVALPKIKEGRVLHEHLDTILEQARKRKVHILVFPELAIDSDARKYLQEKLKNSPRNSLVAVIAGSFHIGEPNPYNESVVWDNRGTPLWTHNKRGRFRLDPWQMELSTTREFFPDMKTAPTERVWEGILPGTELVVADTTLGRLAVLICADALEPERGYLELVGRAHPDLVVIVAMSPKTGDFEDTRKRLVRQNIGVILVNAACVCQQGRKHSGEMAILDLSFHESGDLLPTRWRWRIGSEPEWYRYPRPEERKGKGKDDALGSDSQTEAGGIKEATVGGSSQTEAGMPKESPASNPWRPCDDLPDRENEEPVVSLLDDGVGLVLNLGAYLRGSASQNS